MTAHAATPFPARSTASTVFEQEALFLSLTQWTLPIQKMGKLATAALFISSIFGQSTPQTQTVVTAIEEKVSSRKATVGELTQALSAFSLEKDFDGVRIWNKSGQSWKEIGWGIFLPNGDEWWLTFSDLDEAPPAEASVKNQSATMRRRIDVASAVDRARRSDSIVLYQTDSSPRPLHTPFPISPLGIPIGDRIYVVPSEVMQAGADTGLFFGFGRHVAARTIEEGKELEPAAFEAFLAQLAKIDDSMANILRSQGDAGRRAVEEIYMTAGSILLISNHTLRPKRAHEFLRHELFHRYWFELPAEAPHRTWYENLWDRVRGRAAPTRASLEHVANQLFKDPAIRAELFKVYPSGPYHDQILELDFAPDFWDLYAWPVDTEVEADRIKFQANVSRWLLNYAKRGSREAKEVREALRQFDRLKQRSSDVSDEAIHRLSEKLPKERKPWVMMVRLLVVGLVSASLWTLLIGNDPMTMFSDTVQGTLAAAVMVPRFGRRPFVGLRATVAAFGLFVTSMFGQSTGQAVDTPSRTHQTEPSDAAPFKIQPLSAKELAQQDVLRAYLRAIRAELEVVVSPEGHTGEDQEPNKAVAERRHRQAIQATQMLGADAEKWKSALERFYSAYVSASKYGQGDDNADRVISILERLNNGLLKPNSWLLVAMGEGETGISLGRIDRRTPTPVEVTEQDGKIRTVTVLTNSGYLIDFWTGMPLAKTSAGAYAIFQGDPTGGTLFTNELGLQLTDRLLEAVGNPKSPLWEEFREEYHDKYFDFHGAYAEALTKDGLFKDGKLDPKAREIIRRDYLNHEIGHLLSFQKNTIRKNRAEAEAYAYLKNLDGLAKHFFLLERTIRAAHQARLASTTPNSKIRDYPELRLMFRLALALKNEGLARQLLHFKADAVWDLSRALSEPNALFKPTVKTERAETAKELKAPIDWHLLIVPLIAVLAVLTQSGAVLTSAVMPIRGPLTDPDSKGLTKREQGLLQMSSLFGSSIGTLITTYRDHGWRAAALLFEHAHLLRQLVTASTRPESERVSAVKQALENLKNWMDRRGVQPVSVVVLGHGVTDFMAIASRMDLREIRRLAAEVFRDIDQPSAGTQLPASHPTRSLLLPLFFAGIGLAFGLHAEVVMAGLPLFFSRPDLPDRLPADEAVRKIEKAVNHPFSKDHRAILLAAISSPNELQTPLKTIFWLGHQALRWSIGRHIVDLEPEVTPERLTLLTSRYLDKASMAYFASTWAEAHPEAALPAGSNGAMAILVAGLLALENDDPALLAFGRPYSERLSAEIPPDQSPIPEKWRKISNLTSSTLKHAREQAARIIRKAINIDVDLADALTGIELEENGFATVRVSQVAALLGDLALGKTLSVALARYRLTSPDAPTDLQSIKDALASTRTLSTLVRRAEPRTGFAQGTTRLWDQATLLESLLHAISVSRPLYPESTIDPVALFLIAPYLEISDELSPDTVIFLKHWRNELGESHAARDSDPVLVQQLRALEHHGTTTVLRRHGDPRDVTLQILNVLRGPIFQLSTSDREEHRERLLALLAAMAASDAEDAVTPVLLDHTGKNAFDDIVPFSEKSLSYYQHAAGIGRAVIRASEQNGAWYRARPWKQILPKLSLTSIRILVNWLVHERRHLQTQIDSRQDKNERDILKANASLYIRALVGISTVKPEFNDIVAEQLAHEEHHESRTKNHIPHYWIAQILEMIGRLLIVLLAIGVPLYILYGTSGSSSVEAVGATPFAMIWVPNFYSESVLLAFGAGLTVASLVAWGLFNHWRHQPHTFDEALAALEAGSNSPKKQSVIADYLSQYDHPLTDTQTNNVIHIIINYKLDRPLYEILVALLEDHGQPITRDQTLLLAKHLPNVQSDRRRAQQTLSNLILQSINTRNLNPNSVFASRISRHIRMALDYGTRGPRGLMDSDVRDTANKILEVLKPQQGHLFAALLAILLGAPALFGADQGVGTGVLEASLAAFGVYVVVVLFLFPLVRLIRAAISTRLGILRLYRELQDPLNTFLPSLASVNTKNSTETIKITMQWLAGIRAQHGTLAAAVAGAMLKQEAIRSIDLGEVSSVPIEWIVWTWVEQGVFYERRPTYVRGAVKDAVLILWADAVLWANDPSMRRSIRLLFKDYVLPLVIGGFFGALVSHLPESASSAIAFVPAFSLRRAPRRLALIAA